jgi:CHAD domain-containing protein
MASTLTAGEAFADVLARLHDTVADAAEGVCRSGDPELLHDLRVAVRQARAVVRAGRRVLTREARDRCRAELGRLADRTSLLRDLDVLLAGFDDLVAEDAAALAAVRARLVRRRASARGALVRTLRSARFAALMAGWRRDLAVPGDGPDAVRSARRVAGRRIATAWKRVARAGRAIDDASPAEHLHTLRKRAKELRYLLDRLGGLTDPEARDALIEMLKRLQDVLGAHQDAVAQRALVREAADHAGAAAAGTELDRALAQRQAAARAGFADAWAELDGSRSRRLVAEVTGD